MKYVALLLLTLSTTLLKAQEPQPPLKQLIQAGKFFDSEAGEFKLNISIFITDYEITAVKPNANVTTEDKKGYTVIDLSQYAVLPGLIDAHTHLLSREVLHPESLYQGLDMAKVLTMEGDAYRAIYGSVRAKAYLEAGITAVQDLGNSGQFADIALRKAIREGLVPGPRMRCSGPGLSSEGGQLPGLIYKHRDLVNDEYRVVKSVDDAIQAVRENVTQGADVIKIYSNNTPNNTMLSVDEMKAIVKEAHNYGIRVTAHATNNRAVYNAVIAGVDGIEHGYQVDDSTLALMAAKKVILVPTDCDSATFTRMVTLLYPGMKNSAEIGVGWRKSLVERFKRALKQGVIIAAGSDDYVDFKMPFAEASKRTLIGYYESGAKITQVLQFATVNASKQLNWSNKIGVIKPGYLADIIAVDFDLDKNINAIMNVHFVMADGKVVKGGK